MKLETENNISFIPLNQSNTTKSTNTLSKNKNLEGIEKKQKELKKACQDFESIFLYYLLKSMRRTIPKEEEGALNFGLGSDLFTEIMDEQLALKVSQTQSLGISKVLYRSLADKVVGATPEKKEEKVFDLRNKGNHVEIKKSQTSMPISDFKPIVQKISVDKVNASPPEQREAKVSDSKTKENYTPSSPDQKKESMVSSPLSDFKPIIQKASQKYNLDPKLISSVIQNESGGNPFAISPKGAKGLMQLTDTTAQELGVKNVHDPEENIFAGTKYLRQLLDRFKGNLKLALAAYNAGPEMVKRYGGIPPFTETLNFVRKVLSGFK